jgi:5-formyltetrahydrofolate cyclo-ligase
MEADSADIKLEKQQLRKAILRARHLLADKPALSRRISSALVDRAEYRDARTLSIYVATPPEVQTRNLIERAWSDGKRVTIPCCIGDELQLFLLDSWDQLVPRTMGILEPPDDLQQEKRHWHDASLVDLFIVPGIAFDRYGGRLGFGKAYYDRLLKRAPASVPKIALAFSCQVVDRVPMTSHDVAMDCVITEDGVFSRTA